MSAILLMDIGNSHIKLKIIESTDLSQKLQAGHYHQLLSELSDVEVINHQNLDYATRLNQWLNQTELSDLSTLAISSVLAAQAVKKLTLELITGRINQSNHIAVFEASSISQFEGDGFTLINGYDNPAKLGVDRFLAIIAATFLNKI